MRVCACILLAVFLWHKIMPFLWVPLWFFCVRDCFWCSWKIFKATKKHIAHKTLKTGGLHLPEQDQIVIWSIPPDAAQLQAQFRLSESWLLRQGRSDRWSTKRWQRMTRCQPSSGAMCSHRRSSRVQGCAQPTTLTPAPKPSKSWSASPLLCDAPVWAGMWRPSSS